MSAKLVICILVLVVGSLCAERGWQRRRLASQKRHVSPRPGKNIYQRPRYHAHTYPINRLPVSPSPPVNHFPYGPTPAIGAQPRQSAHVKTFHTGQSKKHNFGYIVQDPEHQNFQGRKEVVADDVIKGTYYLMEADGSLRRVDYVADPVHGFRAIVTDKHGTQAHGY